MPEQDYDEAGRFILRGKMRLLYKFAMYTSLYGIYRYKCHLPKHGRRLKLSVNYDGRSLSRFIADILLRRVV
jgi:hypothetical protein